MSDFHVFTTALAHSGEVKWLPEHLQRLAAHAHHFGIHYPGDDTLHHAIFDHVGEDTHLIKVTLYGARFEISTRAVRLPQSYECSEIVVSDICVEAHFSSFKTSKSSSYLRASEFAATSDAFEALLVDEEGYVVDGSRSSPLLFQDGVLISLEGGLAGITRGHVLKAAADLGIPIAHKKLRPHELDGVLLVAGSGIGLVPGAVITDERVRALVKQFRVIE